EQRDLRDAQDPRSVEEFLGADVTKSFGRTDSAGFAVCEAQDVNLPSLVGEVGEERAEPEGLVVGMRDHRSDRSVGDWQHRHGAAHPDTTGSQPHMFAATDASLPIGRAWRVFKTSAATRSRTGKSGHDGNPDQENR